MIQPGRRQRRYRSMVRGSGGSLIFIPLGSAALDSIVVLGGFQSLIFSWHFLGRTAAAIYDRVSKYLVNKNM